MIYAWLANKEKKMHKILLASLLVCSTAFAADNIYTWKVNRVLDGDTVVFKVDFLPVPLKPVLSVRVIGIDTPEKFPHSKCVEENLLAQKASAYTKNLISTGKDIKVKLVKWDKYGGRVDGDIIVDGKSLSELLISSGNAREYHGGTKKSWCVAK